MVFVKCTVASRMLIPSFEMVAYGSADSASLKVLVPPISSSPVL
jgi:hypothetical protein